MSPGSNEHLLYMEHVDGKLQGVTSKLLVQSSSPILQSHIRALLEGIDDVGAVSAFKVDRGFIIWFSSENIHGKCLR